MNRDLLNEKLLNNLPNTTIDVDCVVDQNHISEILVFAEFVWENMQENELSCDWEKQVGKTEFGLCLYRDKKTLFAYYL